MTRLLPRTEKYSTARNMKGRWDKSGVHGYGFRWLTVSYPFTFARTLGVFLSLFDPHVLNTLRKRGPACISNQLTKVCRSL
jgi:hypothetical protein